MLLRLKRKRYEMIQSVINSSFLRSPPSRPSHPSTHKGLPHFEKFFRYYLNCIMLVHNESESFLDTGEEDLLIVDVDTEFSLYGIVDEDTSPDADLVVLSLPIGLKGDWNSIPSEPIDLSEPLSASLDDPLRDQMWLLLQVGAMGQNQ